MSRRDDFDRSERIFVTWVLAATFLLTWGMLALAARMVG